MAEKQIRKYVQGEQEATLRKLFIAAEEKRKTQAYSMSLEFLNNKVSCEVRRWELGTLDCAIASIEGKPIEQSRNPGRVSLSDLDQGNVAVRKSREAEPLKTLKDTRCQLEENCDCKAIFLYVQIEEGEQYSLICLDITEEEFLDKIDSLFCHQFDEAEEETEA